MSQHHNVHASSLDRGLLLKQNDLIEQDSRVSWLESWLEVFKDTEAVCVAPVVENRV